MLTKKRSLKDKLMDKEAARLAGLIEADKKVEVKKAKKAK